MIVYRTTDWEQVAQCTDPYKEGLHGFYPKEWVEDRDNIALMNDDGDLALFEFEKEGVYTGHYFFVNKGRRAIDAGKQFLKSIFKYGEVEVIRGLTPLRNKPARWMSRKLGFKSYGTITSYVEDHELFILTKKEHNNE